MKDKLWQELVDVAQATAGASAVYLGILEQGEEARQFVNRSGKDVKTCRTGRGSLRPLHQPPGFVRLFRVASPRSNRWFHPPRL